MCFILRQYLQQDLSGYNFFLQRFSKKWMFFSTEMKAMGKKSTINPLF